MISVIGVRFKEIGKIYYFRPGGFKLHVGDKVVVDTARGLECGTVVLANREIDEFNIASPLKDVIRIATREDIEQVQENKKKEALAFRNCKSKIIEHALDMKLIGVEYSFDGLKIVFYFTASGRVDFRDLVKDLANHFKVRIELRQVGVRDETKLVGGVGACGRTLCCNTYLSEFVPVSIKMAKEQHLSLNPQKISGVCGRLMCCLKNEADTYEELNAKLPKEGERVKTNSGIEGEVLSVNVLREKVKIIVTKENDEKELVEVSADEIRRQSDRRRREDR